MEISEIIGNLLQYAQENLQLDARDVNYRRNKILEILGLESVDVVNCTAHFSVPDEILDSLVNYCVEHKIIEDWQQEELTDKVMSTLSLTPAQVGDRFDSIYKLSGAKAATDWLYAYCVKNSYVKRAKLDKNPRFEVNGLVVTINKSKPEFRDPKKAAAGNSVKGGYPKCVICRENEGYATRNKRTLTTVSLKLSGEDFFWQYSPYGYFNEHGIAVNCKHIPMYVDKSTFFKLMDFVDAFPHYFIGCNAPLPRIGGSVLAHDHFQGGGEILPLHKAGIKKYVKDPRNRNVKIGVLDWPGTVVRVCGDRNAVAEVCEQIRMAWVNYDNPQLGIVHEDKDGVHNAVSPTVVKTKDGYEMNLILRSNITSERYPDGVFHAHPEFHVIKKESIGLIEAQGLFILPGRLEKELARVERCVENGKLDNDLQQFELIYNETKALYHGDAHKAMQEELGSVCYRILQNTAVFDTEQTVAFLKEIGFEI